MFACETFSLTPFVDVLLTEIHRAIETEPTQHHVESLVISGKQRYHFGEDTSVQNTLSILV